MSITYTPLNVGTGPDSGDGQSLRSGGILINQSFVTAYTTINNILTALGVVDETSVDLGTFAGTTIPDGRTVKQALQALETYVESLNVLEPGYVAGAPVVPVAGDTVEAAIAKLHGMLASIDSAVVLRGTWNAGSGTFPGAGTAQAGASYIVSGAGTVDGVSFAVGDRIIAIVDNASTTSASAWFKADYTDQVGSVFGRQGAVVAQAGDYTAVQVTNTPAGGVSATTVQAAINELDGDKLNVSLLAAKGSIVSASAANTPQELGVGVDGEALTADSATLSGLRYTAQVSRTLEQANLTVNTALTAATSVDVVTHIAFAQTTANIQVTIPNPTVQTRRRTIMLSHNGTADLQVLFTSGTGFFLLPGASIAVTWSGSAWQANLDRLAVAGEHGEVVLSGSVSPSAAQNGSGNAATAMTFTLPSAGTWRVHYQIRVTNNSTSFVVVGSGLYNAAGTLVPNSEMSPLTITPTSGMNPGATGFGVATITTTGPETCTIRVWNASGSGTATVTSSADGRTKVAFQKVAGFAPVLGSTVEFAAASVGSASLTVGDTVPLANYAGNIANASGVFTLRAGRTYRLQAGLEASGPSASSGVAYSWRNITGAALIGVRGVSRPQDFVGAFGEQPTAEAVISPTQDITVRLECTSVGTISLGWATITQLGSTAFSGPSMPNVIRFTASGTYTPTPGLRYAIVEAVGGGASGGYSTSVTSTQHNAGGGGGSGGYVKARLTPAQIGASVAVTVGAGGATSGAGGGTTTFGALLTANGGAAGSSGIVASNGSPQISPGGSGGGFTVAVGTDLGSRRGGHGTHGLVPHTVGNTVFGGSGGDNPLGGGATGGSTPSGFSNGSNASANSGAGGGGAAGSNTLSPGTGGNGGSGLVIVTEYFL